MSEIRECPECGRSMGSVSEIENDLCDLCRVAALEAMSASPPTPPSGRGEEREKIGIDLSEGEITMNPDLEDVIRALYASEINCRVSAFWDAGITVELGDEANGFRESATFDIGEMDKAALWLDERVRAHYPHSVYAKPRPPARATGGIVNEPPPLLDGSGIVPR